MLLRSIAPNYCHQNHGELCISSSASFPSCGYLRNSASFLIKPVVFTRYGTRRKSASVTCLSKSKFRSYRTVDYERRPPSNWKDLCKRISLVDSLNRSSASVFLSQAEGEGELLSKWDLCRVVKELRKFRRYKSALEVYEWMNSRDDKYLITSSDAAIQLDLIAKVEGVQCAEHYLQKLSNGLKDRRVYGSLLNVYVHAGMRESAEFLMKEMRKRGYFAHTLSYNVMMTLYMKLKDHNKIELLVSEMKEKNVALDVCTYNIWMSSCGYQGSIAKMEQVYEQMKADTTVRPIWTTFSTMATMYIKLGEIEKAAGYLRKIESMMTGRDREPYHYLISLYGSSGKKESVYRIWNDYKNSFSKIPNFGFQAVISTLIAANDIDGAEKLYDEWLGVKTKYDHRIGNLILARYVKEGKSDKVKDFFNQMIEAGGEPNSMAWEILSEDHIRNLRISEAVSCLRNAATVNGSKRWKPKPANVSAILEICEEEDDMANKDVLMDVLQEVRCLSDTKYMGYVSDLRDGKITSCDQADRNGDGDCIDTDVYQFLESL
ncbi:pentatricopeptide repeat-containing protein At1g02150-like [Andrographis paniculata]|uniref:pentatricopeptide repeat-containing protein At1g02150-like n=1 Tax=Andrographis paniculata TaxID=175694 RepID=UPI0021E7CF3E|nr:pentatricopeptide repeat-containing protein At1g02150-like [Andrographis paniculata]